MHWFRSRASLGGWLALFALAVQLVASFGHVHLDRSAAAAGHLSALAQVHAPMGADAPSVPAGDEAPKPAHDYCAVCALIHLAGTAIAAEPASLPLPVASGGSRVDHAVASLSIAQDHTPFAARAPPTA
jgi:hypothetical protein